MKILIIFLGLTCSLAFAQDLYIGEMLDATTFIESLQEESAEYLPQLVSLAQALTVLGVVGGVIAGIFKGSVHASAETFFRGLVVMALLIMTPQITAFTYDTWNGVREWSMEKLEGTVQEGGDELTQLGADAALLAGLFAAPGVGGAAKGVIKLVGTGSKTAVASGSTQIAGSAAAKRMQTFLQLSLIPIVFFLLVVHLIILLTGLTVALSNLILPVAAGMLMASPKNGEKWLGNYVGSVAAAILIAWMIPLGFNGAFNVAIVTPVKTVNQNFEGFDEIRAQLLGNSAPARIGAIEDEIAARSQRMSEIKGDAENQLCQISPDLIGCASAAEFRRLRDEREVLKKEESALRGTWIDQAYDQMDAALFGALAEIRNWLLRLGLLIIGAAFGSYLLWHVSRSVSGLVGGVAMQAVQIATSPLKALGGKSGGGGGGGGGNAAPSFNSAGGGGGPPKVTGEVVGPSSQPMGAGPGGQLSSGSSRQLPR